MPTSAEAPGASLVEPAPIFAWSGAGTGEQLGRAAATTMHQARTALARLQQATAEARESLLGAGERLTQRAKQVLPVNPGEE